MLIVTAIHMMYINHVRNPFNQSTTVQACYNKPWTNFNHRITMLLCLCECKIHTCHYSFKLSTIIQYLRVDPIIHSNW